MKNQLNSMVRNALITSGSIVETNVGMAHSMFSRKPTNAKESQAQAIAMRRAEMNIKAVIAKKASK